MLNLMGLPACLCHIQLLSQSVFWEKKNVSAFLTLQMR